MDFARAQLLKYGWEEGKGLGKDETGRKECIKAKLKMDKTGIGHDVSKEYTNHWWDNVFNKTASSIKVKSTEDGVEIQKSSKQEKEISKNLQTYSKKAMAYGNFVKKATLEDGCEKDEEKVKEEKEPESESAGLTQKYCLLPGQEDEIFSKCGGRTAHKGARHGLKLNGKLLRIQEQEQILLDKIQTQAANQDDCDIKDNDEVIDYHSGKKRHEVKDDGEMIEKKRKKKKKKSKDCKEESELKEIVEEISRKPKKQKVCDNSMFENEISNNIDCHRNKGPENEGNAEEENSSEGVMSGNADGNCYSALDIGVGKVSKKKKKKKKKSD